jgi:hypothetical protein
MPAIRGAPQLSLPRSMLDVQGYRVRSNRPRLTAGRCHISAESHGPRPLYATRTLTCLLWYMHTPSLPPVVRHRCDDPGDSSANAPVAGNGFNTGDYSICDLKPQPEDAAFRHAPAAVNARDGRSYYSRILLLSWTELLSATITLLIAAAGI